MAIIIHHSLSDMQRRLTHQVLEFLPPAVSGNLLPLISISIMSGNYSESHPLEKHDESIIRPAGSGTASLFSAKQWHGCRQDFPRVVAVLLAAARLDPMCSGVAEWGVCCPRKVFVCNIPSVAKLSGPNLPDQGWFGWVCNWEDCFVTRLQVFTVGLC